MTEMRHGYSPQKKVGVAFDTTVVDPKTGEELLDPRHRSLTQQAFVKDCDINGIMARYEKTGLLNHVAKYQGHYGDFSGPTDYHTAMNMVIAAREMFETLPSGLRKQFANDAGAFLQWANDPENEAAMREMGLLPQSPLPSAEPPQKALKAPKGEAPTPEPAPQASEE